MRSVFVDTSAFLAALHADDPLHSSARHLFERAEEEHWDLVTSNYVVHETWSLIQRRMGWDAVDEFHEVYLPMCAIEWITREVYEEAARLCREHRLRHLSITDCSSFVVMRTLGVTEALAFDEHFHREGFSRP